jgi:autotransporter-associated beta strand protein
MKIGTGPLSLIVALLSGALVSPLPAQINGVNDNIVSANLNNSGSYSLGSIAGLGGDLTIEGWVNLGSYANWARIVDLGNGATASNILLATEGTTGKPIFEIYNGSTSVGRVIAPNAVALNTWVHVAGVVQADRTMRLYVNGTQVATSTTSVDAPTVTRTSNFIGKSNWAGDSLLNGAVADVRIWNTARSQTEIQGNMDVGSIAGPTAGLVAGYTLGATGAAPLNDISGNGYTATQSGDITYSKFDTGTLTTGGFTGSTTTLNSAQGVLNLTGNNSVKNVTVNSAGISQAIGTLTTSQAGDGAFQVGVSSGQNGTYTLSGGTISVNGDGNVQIGASGTGTMNQSGGTFTGTEWMVIGRYTNSTGTYNLSGGTLRQSDAATKLIVGENGAGTLNVSGTGVVDSAGGLSISHGSSGVGTVNLNGGTILAPSIVKGSGDTATLNFNGGTLKATGNATNLISGLNTAALLAGGGTIDDGGFTVTMAQVLSGTGNFTKTGAGTLTLSGNSTYTGGTVVNAGTLALTGTLANNTNASITANNGGTFSIARDNFMGGHQATVLSPININAGGQVTGGTFLNTIGALNLNGGTLTSSGGNSFWGNLAFVLKGAVTASGDVTSTIGGSGAMMLGGDTVNSITFSVANGSADTDLLVSAVLDNGATASWPTRQASSLVKTGDGKMVLAANNTYSGTTTISGGVLQVGNGGTTGSLGSGNVTNNATLAVSRNNAYTLGNTISGTGSLVQAGTGTTTLSGNNSFSGGTFVNAGVLQANTEAQLGASNGAITLNGGQLMNNNSDLSLNAARTVTLGPSGGFFEAGWNRTITVAGRIGGTGGVGVVWNAGTLILSGSNSYAGATTIGTTGNGFYNNAAATPTLRLGNANALPSTSLLVFGTNAQNNTATLDLNGFAATVGGLSGSGNARITSGVGGAVTLTTAPTNGTATFAGIIGNGSGTVSLVKSGAGTQVLTGANTYTGGTTINAGSLQIGAGSTSGALGSGNVTNNATLAFNRSDTIAVGNTISGTGSLVQAGSGITTLSGTNTYSGGTTINSGVLRVTTESQLGASNGTLTLNGGQLNNNDSVLSLNAARSVTLGASGGFLEAGWNKSVTVAGQISGAGGLGVVWNGGTVILSGSNTYAGTTTIGTNGNSFFNNAGANPTLRLGNANALPSTGLLVFGTNAQNNTATLDLNGFAATVGGLSGSGNARITSGVGGAVTLTTAPTNGTATFAGIIGNGSGTVSLVKSGSGTQTLTGVNTFTGGTTVSGGTLALSNNNANVLSGAVTVNAGATLRAVGMNIISDTSALTLNGGTYAMGSNGDYIGSLTMNGNATVAGTSGTGGGQFILTTGQATNSTIKTLTASGTNNAINVNIGISSQWGGVGGNANLHFNVVGASDNLTVSGVIADKSFDGGGNATSGAITKTGQGTLVLLGNNSYSGGAVISSGTIQVGNGGTTGNITGNDAAIVNNGTLIINRANGFGLGNAISGGGALVQAGAGTTTVSGANSFTGGTTINAGALLLSAANRLADSGAVTVNGGSFNLGGFSDTVGVVTLAGGVITNGTLTGSSYDLQSGSVSAVLAGNATLTKTGAGVATLTASNTYTGPTVINEGRLATVGHNRIRSSNSVTVNTGGTFAIGGDQTLATIAGAGAVELGGRLTTGTSNSIFAGSMSGNGGLTKVGVGTFTLSGANTYVGDTLLTGGTLVLNNANALWTGGVLSMEAGTILTVNQRTFIGALDQGSGTVNGPGELVATLTLTESGALNAVLADGTDFAAGILKRTSGTTTIGAANTFTGAINVQGGTLQLAAGGSFDAASSLALSSGATMDLNNKAQTFSAVQGTGGAVALGSGSLTVNNGADNSFGGAITGTGGVTKNGAGMMELTGANTYTGTTTVGAGTLAINGNNSAATGAVTVQSGATLAGSGTVGGATTIQSGATHAPGNSPGLQTFNNGLTYATSSTFQWELIGNTEDGRGTNFDGVNVSGGTLSIGSRVTSSLVFNTAGSSVSWADSFWDSDRSWLVFANTNNPTLARTAVFDTINLSADSLGSTLTSVRSNASFAWNQQGNDVYLTYTAVPEPSTYALLVLAAAALGFHALRRRRRA